MKHRGVFIVLATIVVLVIGAAGAVGWYITRETPEPFEYDDVAIWAPNLGSQTVLLDVDDDGSLLVAFYDGGRSIDYEVTGAENIPVIVGQQPGVAVVTPDGEPHVLSEPKPLADDVAGEAVGSIHRGSVAVAWQVRGVSVNGEGKLVFQAQEPTVAMAIGSADGLEPMPVPVRDGAPLSVQWGGLHVADGVLVALVMEVAQDSSFESMTGIIDLATGEFIALDTGASLAPMRDLCDPNGGTFGYVATGASGEPLEAHQFSVMQGEASGVRQLVPPETIARAVPFNACGSDTAGVDRTSEALVWTDGQEAALSTAFVGSAAGDVFLAPEWAAVHGLSFGDFDRRVLVVDRETKVVHTVSANCDRLVASGDWIAFGYPEGDTCRPVAVPASAVLGRP
ncbi:hypothetical protein LGT39_10305 [Demequina sp. TTPB684]|uniref:hypothetical protein n=1 Tax=unclassified Demequina TaxID=2620311 RepID=UPI001CF413FC|nr:MULTISPECIES: hypothetical protein [unclassified Demequina]MCB2413233.1 hypothetical protein [Demequina sp. TTPB684]UPU88192.1 hypothetical protein LGT36_013245 [Demequina sp. TMPB413]